MSNKSNKLTKAKRAGPKPAIEVEQVTTRPKSKGKAAPVVVMPGKGTTHIRVTQNCADKIKRLVSLIILNGNITTNMQAVEAAVDMAIAAQELARTDNIKKIVKRAGVRTQAIPGVS